MLILPNSRGFLIFTSVKRNSKDIIKIGIKNYQDNNNKVHSFDSNILAGYSGAKGAKGSKFGYKGSKF